uniref:ARAD1C26158p n=1 Tax=Blastobotrys adeninivorans TaxID=409370 RepID=A0A060T765_BLAAD
MIDLGLSRIYRLLTLLGCPHLKYRAIHVAGTNGKGSVCAYISSVLTEARIPNGRFTSPHLIDRWDCITVNGATVKEEVFRNAEALVTKTNEQHGIGASEFELLTATAFEIFNQLKVRLAVIEVGLGGRLDSTNVLSAENTVATVITKIGLDHQGFLGNTIEEIAGEKAGIIKERVPCIVDSSNVPSVLKVVEGRAQQKEAPVIFTNTQLSLPFGITRSQSPLNGSYQLHNLACALNAIKVASKEFAELQDEKIVQQGIAHTKWPGRLQWVEFGSKTILLDGAHNAQSASLLAEYVDNEVRGKGPVTFVVAFSGGRDCDELFNAFVREDDTVICTEFGPVDGMPWVNASKADQVAISAKKFTDKVNVAKDVKEAVESSAGTCVVCGSLYLVSEVLKLTRS